MALATSSEDGNVKIWSRQGVLRSNLVQSDSPVYSLAWSYDETFMIYTSGKNLSIKPVLKGGLKTLTWKAHDETVLCVDWNYSNKLIVSGGEDRKYKVKYIKNLFRFGINMEEICMLVHRTAMLRPVSHGLLREIISQ